MTQCLAGKTAGITVVPIVATAAVPFQASQGAVENIRQLSVISA